MLILKRITGQQIIIAGTIRITVLKAQKDRVELGIQAPAETHILRAELELLPISGFSPTFRAITQRVTNRWNEAGIRPLPSDDPEDQVLFFLGMVDEAEKDLDESEQKDLRAFLFQLVNINEDW